MAQLQSAYCRLADRDVSRFFELEAVEAGADEEAVGRDGSDVAAAVDGDGAGRMRSRIYRRQHRGAGLVCVCAGDSLCEGPGARIALRGLARKLLRITDDFLLL